MEPPDVELIQKNIQKFGYHSYVVTGGSVPRFAYTIGLLDSIEAELVLAGAIHYNGDEVLRIIGDISEQLKRGAGFDSVFKIDGPGSFTLHHTHHSWNSSLLLGALDYYKTDKVNAYQILPDEARSTIDIPNLNAQWSAIMEPAWKWLHEKWTYPVSPKSTAFTNMDALRGARVTEAARWEEDHWEIFAGPGPDVAFEDSRVVPLGTLLAADPSLTMVVDLNIGEGLWREDTEKSAWHPWGKS
jgi:hypothetical protein